MKKTGPDGKVYKLSVSFKIIDVSNIVSIHEYLMKQNNIV